MQKIINVLALASFGVSAAAVGSGAYVYLNKDSIIENVKGQVAAAAAEAISGALPGMLDSAMPELPGATGGVVGGASATGGMSIPSVTGGAMPF